MASFIHWFIHLFIHFSEHLRYVRAWDTVDKGPGSEGKGASQGGPGGDSGDREEETRRREQVASWRGGAPSIPPTAHHLQLPE